MANIAKKLAKEAEQFAEENWNGKYTSKEDVAKYFLIGAAAYMNAVERHFQKKERKKAKKMMKADK